MNRTRYTLPPRSVTRPEPALEPVLIMVMVVGMLALFGLLWSALTGESLSPLSWYIVRASGLSLYLLSWFLVMSGLGASTKLMVHTGNRGVAMSLHTYAFHLWYGLLALHMLSIAIDPAVNFGLAGLVVPFTSGWREPWTGLGILAAQLGVITGASAAFRRVVGYRVWKAMHWLSLPVYGLGLFHGIMAGTDGRTTWAFMLYMVTGGWVVFLLAYRILRRHVKAERSEARLPRERFRTQVKTGE